MKAIPTTTKAYVLIAVGGFGALALAALAVVSIPSPEPDFSWDFDGPRAVQTAFRQWQILGKAKLELVSSSGVRIEPEQMALFVSPRLPDARRNDFPYVKLHVKPASEERLMAVVWIYRMGQEAPDMRDRWVFKVPAGASELLLDTRQKDISNITILRISDAWLHVPIERIGFLVQDAVEIERVEFRAALAPAQLPRLMWSQYWEADLFLANSINSYIGNQILGVRLSVLLGALFIALFALVLISRVRKFKPALLGAMFACFIAVDLPYIRSLWDHAGMSSEVSAWHFDRYDEYRSRFDQEFADLDKVFREQIPVGARVAFPASRQQFFTGETNWIWFLYYDLYDNYRDRNLDSASLDKNTEYVFYYHPHSLVHDEKGNTVHNPGKKSAKVYRTQTIAEISEHAKILRILHD